MANKKNAEATSNETIPDEVASTDGDHPAATDEASAPAIESATEPTTQAPEETEAAEAPDEPKKIVFEEKTLNRFLNQFASNDNERKRMLKALEDGADPQAMREQFYPDSPNLSHFDRYFQGQVRKVIARAEG